MAFGHFRSGYVGVAGVYLSDHVREFSIETSVAELPNNVHGDYVSKVIGGLEDWTITVTFLQDFAASKVDATLSGINAASQTGSSIEVGADKTTAIGTTNPRYSGTAIMTSYRPIGGAHGTNLEATATFRPAGRLTRRTA